MAMRLILFRNQRRVEQTLEISRKSYSYALLIASYSNLQSANFRHHIVRHKKEKLKDNSGVADAVCAGGIHIPEHYLVTVCVREEYAFSFTELFCCGHSRCGCACAAGIAVFGSVGEQPLRLELECQIDEHLVIYIVRPF